MLVSLRIQNYALIRQLEIQFGPGLNVLTGETGAGKSILLGAFGLVLGERASLDDILDKKSKCVVECEVDISALQLEEFLSLHDIDYDDHTIIRREITPAGKSRAFVNDTPVTLDILRELGYSLVEIHSQHSTISLYRPSTQLSVLDHWSGIQEEVESFRVLFYKRQQLQSDITGFRNEHEKLLRNQEFLMTQLDELKAAAYKAGEKSELEKELEVLENGEEIMQALSELDGIVNDEEHGISRKMTMAGQRLERIGARASQFRELADRLESLHVEFRDIAEQLAREGDHLDFSPERLSSVRERLDLVNHLEHKHGIIEEDGLIRKKEEIEYRLGNLTDNSSQLLTMEAELERLSAEIETRGSGLSKARKTGAEGLAISVLRSLEDVGLAEAAFYVDVETDDEAGPEGFERVRFLFSAHEGLQAGDLGKIASGGELARIMLALKENISQKRLLPTIIFDEIDSGISGSAASLVGRKMSVLGRNMQVLAVTHQPSIAGFGDVHYLVFKEKEGTFIHSKIKKLSDNERVEVLAGMISGGQSTEASMQAATELLSSSHRD